MLLIKRYPNQLSQRNHSFWKMVHIGCNFDFVISLDYGHIITKAGYGIYHITYRGKHIAQAYAP